MRARCGGGCDRRCFIATGIGAAAWAALPAPLRGEQVPSGSGGIEAVVRPPTLFAGIRKPISERAELAPRVEALEAACGDKVSGPLTHIFRFDTRVFPPFISLTRSLGTRIRDMNLSIPVSLTRRSRLSLIVSSRPL